jgi:hypothetical protein
MRLPPYRDFTFLIVDARPVLQAYDITSRTLVTK